MTLVILSAGTASAQPWGWWDDEDSLARPEAPGDSLSTSEGRASLGARSDGFRRSRPEYDLSGRFGPVRGVLAGRADSGWSPILQRADWRDDGAAFEIGDLVPWNSDPLLEGASRPSGSGHPLRRLGSGNAAAGLDADVADQGVLPRGCGIRTRISASPSGKSRSSALARLGPARVGATVAEEGARLGYGGIRLATGDATIDGAALTDGFAFGFAVDGALAAGAGRHELSIRHVDRALSHDGMRPGWSGATSARIQSRWRTRTRSAGIGVDAGTDSAAKTTTRLLCDASQELLGLEGRVRARWSRRDETRELRIVPGLTGRVGEVRPWVEAPWTEGRGFDASFGARWSGPDVELDASATRGSGGWRWRVSSGLGAVRHGGGSRLSIAVGGAEGIEKGEGRWVTSW